MDQILPDEDKIIKEMAKETLCQDDFIEWVLRSTNEDSEFRVYKAGNNIIVGIDRSPFKE